MKMLLLRATLFLASFQLFAAESPATQTNFIAIKAGHLIDTVKGVVLERQVILIENDSIKWVKADDPGAAPKEAKTIDLSDYTVLPGAD